MKKFLFLIVVCFLLCSCKEEEIQTSTNETIDFVVKTKEKENFVLSEKKGKPVLVNFFATWCPPCVEEMPAFEKIIKEYGDKIEFLAIDCGEEEAVVNKFIEENNYSFNVGYDEDMAISNIFNITGIPYTVIFDKEGNIFKDFVGARGAEAQYLAYTTELNKIIE